MQIAAKRNLVLTTVSSLNILGGTYQADRQGELYQPIARSLIRGIHKRHSLEVGTRLIAVAEHALGMNQTDIVEQAGQVLMNAPLPREYRSIGQYYQALCITRRGDSAASTAILEGLADSPATPLKYRARALKAIGGNHIDLGNLEESLRFFLEASRAALPQHGSDPLTATLSPWMIAVIKSLNGDHIGAMTDLQKLFPFVRLIAPDYPQYHYAYFNALAVELGELNRIEEAQNALRIALASPFTHQHLEMQRTAKEFGWKAQCASRSIVAINKRRVQSEVLSGGQTIDKLGEQVIAEQKSTPGEKLLLFRGRTYQPEEPLYSPIEAKHNQLSPAQKRCLLNDISGNLSEDALDRLLALARELDAQPSPVRRPREINLEEKSTLEQLMTLWVNGDFGPDDFAAVMSALRDCDNDLRRKTIIDQMISYSFYFTRDRMEGEDFWRKRVEARLTPEPDAG